MRRGTVDVGPISNRPLNRSDGRLACRSTAAGEPPAATGRTPIGNRPHNTQDIRCAMRSLLGMAVVLAAMAPLVADDWTGFRGPNGSGLSKEKGLLADWGEKGPKLVFQSDKAGRGYSGMAIVKGVVYTMGAFDNDEYALALDAKGGL